MLIHVQKIPWEGLDIEGEEPPEALDLENEADRIRPSGPLVYRLHARVVSREVLVRGRLSAAVEFRCSRCNEFFESAVISPSFQEVYAFTDPHAILDLTCDLRESIILAFPSFPVCKQTCRGLCPQCGANRNRSDCACAGAPPDARWSAFDRLTLSQTNGTHP